MISSAFAADEVMGDNRIAILDAATGELRWTASGGAPRVDDAGVVVVLTERSFSGCGE